MTVEVFMVLLSILSIVTSLCTQGVKKFLTSMKKNYAANIVVLVISIIVGGIGTVVYYMYDGVAWTPLNITIVFLMMLANWLGAMLEYDKIMQAITQIKSK